MTIRILVADDQELIRSGIVGILNTQPDFDVVGEAEDGNEAVTKAKQLRPDVCLFDIRMPTMDGIEATNILAGPTVHDPLAIVILTTFDLDEYVHGALKAGARGFLLKDCGREMLFAATYAAARGDAMIAPHITRRLLAEFAKTVHTEPPQPIESLTNREEEVLRELATGSSNAEIARNLNIGTSTVKTHLGNLTTKIGARNRVELAIWAHETGRIG